jgi:hypothetical protein
MMDAKTFLDSISGYTASTTGNGSADRPVRLAIVDPTYTGAPALPQVYFEGESDISGRTFAYTQPVNANDRVALVPVGNTYLIIGAIGGTLPGVAGFKIKSSATTRASTITSASDPHLFTPTLQAGKTYLITFRLWFASLQAAGIRTKWDVPSGTSGNKEVMGPAVTNAVQTTDGVIQDLRWAVHGYATEVGYTDARNNTGLYTWCEESSLVDIGATAGPITMQWAQNNSNATGTILQPRSYVRWQQVS